MIYVFFTAAFDRINELTWWAFGVVIIELLALVFNNWSCPLTDLAEHLGAEVGSVANIFFPKRLSDNLFAIFGIFFVLTCLLIMWRTII